MSCFYGPLPEALEHEGFQDLHCSWDLLAEIFIDHWHNRGLNCPQLLCFLLGPLFLELLMKQSFSSPLKLQISSVVCQTKQCPLLGWIDDVWLYRLMGRLVQYVVCTQHTVCTYKVSQKTQDNLSFQNKKVKITHIMGGGLSFEKQEYPAADEETFDILHFDKDSKRGVAYTGYLPFLKNPSLKTYPGSNMCLSSLFEHSLKYSPPHWLLIGLFRCLIFSFSF